MSAHEKNYLEIVDLEKSSYETVWNPSAFVKTTLIPLALMFVVNLLVIARKMRHTPLAFLWQDLKKGRRKKAIRLPEWKFFSRFRMHIIFQNVPNYLILFFGVFFVMVMLAMAVGIPLRCPIGICKYEYIRYAHAVLFVFPREATENTFVCCRCP